MTHAQLLALHDTALTESIDLHNKAKAIDTGDPSGFNTFLMYMGSSLILVSLAKCYAAALSATPPEEDRHYEGK